MPTASKIGKVRCRETCVVTVGARPVEYRTAVVRDRHSGKLAEVALTEYPPIDPGSEGRFYTFKRGEEVEADHEAVLESPGSFVPVEE